MAGSFSIRLTEPQVQSIHIDMKRIVSRWEMSVQRTRPCGLCLQAQAVGKCFRSQHFANREMWINRSESCFIVCKRVSDVQEKVLHQLWRWTHFDRSWSGAQSQGHHHVVQAWLRTQCSLVWVQSWSWTFIFIIIITIISPSSSTAAYYITISWYILNTEPCIFFSLSHTHLTANQSNQPKELYRLDAVQLSPNRMCFLYKSYVHPVVHNTEVGLGLVCLGFGSTSLCSVLVPVKAASTTLSLMPCMVSRIIINLEYSHVDGTDFVYWFFVVLRAQLWVATGSKVNLSTGFCLTCLLSPNWFLPGPQVLVSAIWAKAGFWTGQRVPEIILELSLCVRESHSVSAAVVSAVCATFAHRQLNQLLPRQRRQTGKTCCDEKKKKEGEHLFAKPASRGRGQWFLRHSDMHWMGLQAKILWLSAALIEKIYIYMYFTLLILFVFFGRAREGSLVTVCAPKKNQLNKNVNVKNVF